jgi:hypothetical protein
MFCIVVDQQFLGKMKELHYLIQDQLIEEKYLQSFSNIRILRTLGWVNQVPIF